MTEYASFAPSVVRRFRAVGYALAGTAVLVVTSLLLPSEADGAVSLTGGSAHDAVTLTVARARTGTTGVDIRVVPRGTGAGVQASTPVVTLQAVLPTAGHATPETTALPTGDGNYRAPGLHLMMPGRWTLLVSVDRGGSLDQYDFPVTISG